MPGRFEPNDPRINRSGRPRGPGVVALATARTLARKEREKCIQVLADIRDNPALDAKVRKDCALALLAYADGTPVAMKAAEPEEPQSTVPAGDLTEAELTAQLSAAPTEGEA